MTPSFRTTGGQDLDLVFSLVDEQVVIGRDSAQAITLRDRGVSRHHAVVMHVGDLYFLRDLGSRNGTFVNSRKIRETVLCDGDLVTIGKTTLAFELGREEQLPSLESAEE